jgi:hypothetical protein
LTFANEPVVKVNNIIQRGQYDVVHYNWILDCVAESTYLPLEPKYMIYMTIETKRKFLKESDRFGDNFSNNATVKSLREVSEFLIIFLSEGISSN